jgi:hypothetical protein
MIKDDYDEMKKCFMLIIIAVVFTIFCSVISFSSPLFYYVNPVNTTSVSPFMINISNYNTYVTQNITQYCTNNFTNDIYFTNNITNDIYFTNNITNNNYLNITNDNYITIDLNGTGTGFIKDLGFNTTYELKNYFDTLYYSILNPYNFVNYTVNTLHNFYNKTDIDFMLLSYMTKLDFSVDNISIWAGIDSKLNITDERYNDTALINSVNSNLSFAIMNNATILNNTILDVNNTLYNMIININSSALGNMTALQTTLNNAITNNISLLNTTLINSINGNYTSLNNNLGTAINNNISLLNTTLINSIIGNFSALNLSFVTADDGLRNAFLNNDTANFLILNNSINTKGTLIGNNVWQGNNYFIGNVTVYNGTQTNFNTSIIVSIGTTVYFNVTYGNVYIGNFLRVNGDVNASNFYGNIGYQYIQNPIWLNITDGRYNDTALINSVSVNLSSAIITNITGLNNSLLTYLSNYYLNATADALNDTYYMNLTLNALNNNISVLNTSLINRIPTNTLNLTNGNNFISNNSNARLLNISVNQLYLNQSSYLYFNPANNESIWRFFRGNLSFWDGSDTIMTLSQDDNVYVRKNIIINGNITTNSVNQSYSNRYYGNTNGSYENSIYNTNTGSIASANYCFYNDLTTNDVNYNCIGTNGINYNDVAYPSQTNGDFFIESSYRDIHFDVKNTSRNIEMYVGGVSSSNLKIEINTNNVTVKTNLKVLSNISVNQGNRICVSSDCSSFMCINSTGSMIISNNRTGVSCN